MDETEDIRRVRVAQLNSHVESDDKASERARLEKEYGRVWDTQQLGEEFHVMGFMAPFVAGERKSDKKKGSMECQHSPRLYFNWKED